MLRNTQAVIHLEHIRHNYELAKRWASGSNNMAIIKANAYGHGSLEVAKHLAPHVPAFGVAILQEAVELRQAGIETPILILQGVQTAEECNIASQLNCWLTIHSLTQLQVLVATPLDSIIKVWLKVDSGMHRLGLSGPELKKAISVIQSCQWIHSDYVVTSHFACASQLDNRQNHQQLAVFTQMLTTAQVESSIAKSFANSAALLNCSESHFDWNRPGIMLYGGSMFDSPHPREQQLRAAMTFESEVIAIRKVAKGDAVGYGHAWRASQDSLIATVAAGYADGYPRNAISGTPVLINGEQAKLTGTVSMDMLSVDVSDISPVKVGDKVELWGTNLAVSKVAESAQTISYDLLTRVSPRVPRVYR